MPRKKSENQGQGDGPPRMRADALLVANGLAASRDRARALILAGGVSVDGVTLSKAGRMLPIDAKLILTAEDIPWVSRGALKLLGGLAAFGEIDPKGRVCLDIGASTGGFTEVLLANGAAKVVAVDVGHDQLHPRLCDDPRVVVMQGVNARTLTPDMVAKAPQLLVCDASFISLSKVLPAAMEVAAPRAYMVALIKPQFEVGKGLVGKGGVVRDPALHASTIRKIEHWLTDVMGWRHIGTVPSPLKGPDGNSEFLIAGQKP